MSFIYAMINLVISLHIVLIARPPKEFIHFKKSFRVTRIKGTFFIFYDIFFQKVNGKVGHEPCAVLCDRPCRGACPNSKARTARKLCENYYASLNANTH